MLIAGAAVVAILATGREQDPRVDFDTTEGISPLIAPGGDHWHDAYLIHRCGEDLPPGTNQNDPGGIHTHADGLIHVHPLQPWAAGTNANFGLFIDAMGGELTDDLYTPGPGEVETVLSEEEGCDGEPAVLQLAVWENALDEEPEIITENIDQARFTSAQPSAYTLALLPEGAEIPKPSLDVLAQYLADPTVQVPIEDVTVDEADDPAETDADDAAETDADDAAETDAEADDPAENEDEPAEESTEDDSTEESTEDE